MLTVSKPHLDGPEHGGRIVRAGIRQSQLITALVVDRREMPE
jgi:hypothetical protein